MVVVPNHAGSLPINSAPTVPSSSNPSPFSHNNVMERGPSPSSNAITDNEPLPSSFKVQSACSFQANPSPTPDVLEESSSQLSEIAVAHNDEPQLVLPSASTSRVIALSHLINNIREDAQTVNQTLDAVIDKISKQLDAIKESESQKPKESKNKSEIILSQESESQKSKESQRKPEKTTNKLLSITSAGLFKLKEFFLEGVNGICSLKDALPAPEASKIARDVVKGLGQAHWVTSGFLLVAYILDSVETVSSNREDCLYLLEQMYVLAVDIKGLAPDTDNPRLQKLVKDGTELIVEASLMCCSQIDRRYFSRFFLTTVNKAELVKFKEKLQDFTLNMIRGMGVSVYRKSHPARPREAARPREKEYPKNAVGIEEPLNSVTELLEWESAQRAVAVLVHGFGGIGKTTLANAVYARYYVKDCKHFVVRLNSAQNIEEMQKTIQEDLMGGTEEGMTMSDGIEGGGTLEFDEDYDRKRKIRSLLKNEAVFLYIDNVVKGNVLQELLSTWQLEDAKKLRVLITARDKDVLSGCKMKTVVYAMKTLPLDHGRSLLIKEIYNNVTDDIKGQIPDSDLEKMVDRSGGIPKLLELIAGAIRSEPDKAKARRIVMYDSERLTGNTFNGIDEYIFAYDLLPDECKNPFLDICYFFKGWEWETVLNIVGESELNQLETRALVSKDNDMISLHDVILTMGKRKAQDTRFDFTDPKADEIEDFFEKDMEDLKLVKGLWFGDQECKIPVDSLNSMHNSLRIFGHKMALKEGQCEKTFDKLLVYKGETPHFPFKWSRLKNIRFLNYQPRNLTLLQEIPSRNLKHIELDGTLCSEREILSSHIQQLQALQVLRLINFHSLEKLPEEWGEYLRENLTELTLSHCTSIKQLTGSISQLRGLKILKLYNCYNLRRFSKDCESLSSSELKLNMWNCLKLKSLPSCFVEALDSESRRLFEQKGILSDSPQSDSDSDYESDED